MSELFLSERFLRASEITIPFLERALDVENAVEISPVAAEVFPVGRQRSMLVEHTEPLSPLQEMIQSVCIRGQP